MTVYGYLRVSCEKQSIDNYKNWILRKANELKLGHVEFIEETVTGKKDWKKRKLGELFDKMVKNDKIITFESSRLGRDFRQTIEFLASCDRKGIQVICGDMVDNSNSLESNLQMFIASASSERERGNISRRTKEALRKKKEEGVILGRKKGIMTLDKDENNIKDIKNMIDNNVKLYSIAEKYNVTPMTLTKFIKKHNLKPQKDNSDKKMQTP
jgi:DNA invertase Pin-like site-specific DNA recombinase